MSEPQSRTPDARKNAHTPILSDATLQNCCASHRNLWPLEPRNHNLPTVGPSKARTIPAWLKASFTNVWSTGGQPNSPNLTVSRAPPQTETKPFTTEMLAEATLPPTTEPAPKEQWNRPIQKTTSDSVAWTWPFFPAHPEPPVYKWHMPGSCPVKQQLQPDHVLEKRCEEKTKLNEVCTLGPRPKHHRPLILSSNFFAIYKCRHRVCQENSD